MWLSFICWSALSARAAWFAQARVDTPAGEATAWRPDLHRMYGTDDETRISSQQGATLYSLTQRNCINPIVHVPIVLFMPLLPMLPVYVCTSEGKYQEHTPTH